jgi:UDPglucose 6-dehydrogenase
MRITVIGAGYVGLVTGTCLADSGNHVVGVDKDQRKLERLRAGQSPIYEPGLSDLLTHNLKAGRLRFTDDLAGSVAASEVVFIAVGTPPRADGTADLSAVEAVAEAVGRALARKTVVVNKSTVPVGTGDRVEAIIRTVAKHAFFVVSNPEFLKEGTAIDDFLRPDRVVIGANESEAGDVIAELHEPFVRNNKPILRVSRRAAELSKYAANAYLSTRISFINEIATICERVGVDVNEVRRAIGSDARIGHHFMYPGLGYGGSCFPKDVQALAASAAEHGVEAWILRAVHQRNLAQRERMIERILGRLGPSLAGRHVAVWGLAFKPNTDDIRDAPAISIIEALVAQGAGVAAYDPEAMPNAQAQFGPRGDVSGPLRFAPNAYAALDGADALVVCTEWNEFRSPDFDELKRRLKSPLVFDGRNLYEPRRMAERGFEYHSVGRPLAR